MNFISVYENRTFFCLYNIELSSLVIDNKTVIILGYNYIIFFDFVFDFNVRMSNINDILEVYGLGLCLYIHIKILD